MRIRYDHIVLVAVVGACMPAWSVDGNGLRTSDSSWFHGRWQARIELSQGLNGRRHIDPYNLIANPARSPLRGLAVLRDYYFDWGVEPDPGPVSTGGLRATGGLLVTPRSTAASTSSRRGSAFASSLSALSGRGLGGSWSAQNDDVIPVPYVGLGYTDLPIRTGWGFRADLGLTAVSPQSAVKFGSALSGGQGIDDIVRDLRVSPLIQIGVSYSF
jgi:hypothetical protein